MSEKRSSQASDGASKVADDATFISWFRQSAPYIRAHRGRTFVIVFGGEVFRSPGLPDLAADVALLHGLGVRLVLVAGSRPQIEKRLAERGHPSRMVGGLRVTDDKALVAAKEAAGSNRVELERLLSMGLPGSPMANARVRVAAGNFVIARPVGVVDGVDYGYTGRVRRIDAEAIAQRLDDGAIVILTPLGYSITGECFNLSTPELAAETATALRADKLVALVEGGRGVKDGRGRLLTELSPDDAEALLGSGRRWGGDVRAHLEGAVRAVRGGVRRAHLLDRRAEGALLRELFTRDGIGTLVTSELFEGVRPARARDVGSILQILEPLERAGLLVHRSRELLEEDIGRFVVVERDGLVLGCAALYGFADGAGELACLAVSDEFREAGRGELLVSAIERRARAEGLDRLFVLTTQSTHFFRERGFVPAKPKDLPPSRKRYDRKRRSKVLVKHL
ncbi:MAG: amino-acid N-acetyltransferase [Myxococcales bacterium]|nr:amino-acid N-acetyltransferase [Myxococcales bacterium]